MPSYLQHNSRFKTQDFPREQPSSVLSSPSAAGRAPTLFSPTSTHPFPFCIQGPPASLCPPQAPAPLPSDFSTPGVQQNYTSAPQTVHLLFAPPPFYLLHPHASLLLLFFWSNRVCKTAWRERRDILYYLFITSCYYIFPVSPPHHPPTTSKTFCNIFSLKSFLFYITCKMPNIASLANKWKSLK